MTGTCHRLDRRKVGQSPCPGAVEAQGQWSTTILHYRGGTLSYTPCSRHLPCIAILKASDAYYSSLETGQHVDGLLGLGTTAGRTHSQTDALVALQQHLDLNPNSAQVRTLGVQELVCTFCLLGYPCSHGELCVYIVCPSDACADAGAIFPMFACPAPFSQAWQW